MFGRNINKSIFSDKAFQSYSFGWKKDPLEFFRIFLFNKLKDLINVEPKRNPLP